ncbi:MAG: hypothetical protein ABI723_22055 [Bacteroidia bacterium]
MNTILISIGLILILFLLRKWIRHFNIRAYNFVDREFWKKDINTFEWRLMHEVKNIREYERKTSILREDCIKYPNLLITYDRVEIFGTLYKHIGRFKITHKEFNDKGNECIFYRYLFNSNSKTSRKIEIDHKNQILIIWGDERGISVDEITEKWVFPLCKIYWPKDYIKL